MIDNFGLALSHGLILLALWRLIPRPDLDDDDACPGGGQDRTKKARPKDRAGA
jgi:hypothetical protein